MYFWPGHERLGFMNNYYESVFDVEGVQFASVSHFVWYMEAMIGRSDSQLSSLVREAKSHEAARRLIREYQGRPMRYRARWEQKRLQVIAKGVMRKFECSDEMRTLLMETGTDRLIYASRDDPNLGIGFTMLDGHRREKEWGHNYLGQILMLVRKRFHEREEE